jgi:hypothetical protein
MVQSSQQNQYDNLRLFPPFFPKKLWAKRGYIELRNGRFIGQVKTPCFTVSASFQLCLKKIYVLFYLTLPGDRE